MNNNSLGCRIISLSSCVDIVRGTCETTTHPNQFNSCVIISYLALDASVDLPGLTDRYSRLIPDQTLHLQFLLVCFSILVLFSCVLCSFLRHHLSLVLSQTVCLCKLDVIFRLGTWCLFVRDLAISCIGILSPISPAQQTIYYRISNSTHTTRACCREYSWNPKVGITDQHAHPLFTNKHCQT